MALLDLDDPSKVKIAKPTTQNLPQLRHHSGKGDKVHQVMCGQGPPGNVCARSSR